MRCEEMQMRLNREKEEAINKFKEAEKALLLVA